MMYCQLAVVLLCKLSYFSKDIIVAIFRIMCLSLPFDYIHVVVVVGVFNIHTFFLFILLRHGCLVVRALDKGDGINTAEINVGVFVCRVV